jgi:YceG-like family
VNLRRTPPERRSRSEQERQHDRSERARRRAERKGAAVPGGEAPPPDVAPEAALSVAPPESQAPQDLPQQMPAPAGDEPVPAVQELTPAIAEPMPAVQEPTPATGEFAPSGGELAFEGVAAHPVAVSGDRVAQEPAPPSEPRLVRIGGRPSSADTLGHGVPPGRLAGGAPRPAGAWSLVARATGLLVIAAIVLVGGLLAVGRLTGEHHTTSPPTPVVERVLVPEGLTRLQIAARAHAAALKGSYLTASKRSALLDPAHYGAPADTPSLEGFLFPATYDLYRGDPAARLVHEQLVVFQENFGDAQERRARELHVTPYQLLIVASIVEREAQLAADRPKVAEVIYNRLHKGMALGVDATIRYALNDYTRPLTSAQLALSSPYNTRLHEGLPPTPISNPGMAAIEAAAHPSHVPYVYYVAGADGCGEQVFSTSFQRFEEDAAAYRSAVRENGGRVPACHGKR